jgi:hypothetical protein
VLIALRRLLSLSPAGRWFIGQLASRDVWAFIRVRDEGMVFRLMLDSIESLFTYGVIGVSSPDNETVDIARNFTLHHHGFVLTIYPFDVIAPGSPLYLSDPLPGPRLDFFYNYVLSFIPRGAWLVKLDADAIYDTEGLREMMTHRLNCDIAISFARLDCWCVGPVAFTVRHNALQNHGDHFMVYNRNVDFELYNFPKGGYMERLRLPKTTRQRQFKVVALHFRGHAKWKRALPATRVPMEEAAFLADDRWYRPLTCDAARANRYCEQLANLSNSRTVGR